MREGTGTEARYAIADFGSIAGTPCPCGEAKRAFMDVPGAPASMHVTTISKDSRTHYHKKLTEYYFVLEGEGSIELDGERFPIGPGSAVMIKPGCRHRAVGEFKMLIVPVPRFDPADEWFD